MSSSTSKKQQTPAATPHQTMRGHTYWVTGVVHLPGGQQMITCSMDHSLRLWDIKSGAQIGEDWRDGVQEMRCMALSPNGETVASGSSDGTVRLWNVETRKVIAKWTGPTRVVGALCWSADGKRVASGSRDGMARVWDVESGAIVLTIKTRHGSVNAVMYSPDNTTIATGGGNHVNEDPSVKIWDSETGELITTLKHDDEVYSLAWTSDGKKLISGALDHIRIFDTATWQQIAVLEGHAGSVDVISLSSNNRILASASWDKTARLWNLDTNLQIGPPLQHEDCLRSAALSADGKVLVTGCEIGNVYTWDIHAILKKAGLEDLLLPISDVPPQKSLTTRDATRRPANIHTRRIPPGFFDDTQSSAAHGSHSHSSSSNPRALFSGFSSFFRHSRSKTDGATELQQRPRRTIFSDGGPPVVDVPTVKDKGALAIAQQRRPRQQQQSQLHSQTQASSSQTQPATASTSTTPPAPGTNATTAGAAPAQSPPISWWARVVLFLCCVSLPRENGH